VLVEGVRYDPRNGAAHLAVSPSGTFVYSPAAPIPPERYVSWLDATSGISRLVDTPRHFGQLRLSPDGSRVALRIGGHAASDLWSLDLASGTLTRLSSGLSPQRPAWRPDGRGVTVAAREGGSWRLLTLPVASEGRPDVLFEGPDRMYPNDWTPDGQALVVQARAPSGEWNLRLLELDAAGRAKGPPRPLVTTPFQEANAAVSPDGSLLSYESDELDGVYHVYVRTFPGGAERIRASASAARRPRWGVDGRLHYWATAARRFESVRLGWQSGHLVAEEAQPMLDPGAGASAVRQIVINPVDGYDIDRSGRLLVIETAAEAGPPIPGRPVVVVRRPSR
jgi:Tol biopolymer transport system component